MSTNPWSNFCYSHWELICQIKWHPETSEISTPPKILVETHFHARHCSPFYQAVQCNHKTPIPLSSRARVRSKKTKKISSLITAASIYRCNKYIYSIRYFQCCTITVRVTNDDERDTMSCPYEARLIPLNINPIFKCL